MATSTRLRGNVNPIFTLAAEDDLALSFADDLKKWEQTPEAKDDSDLTFAEAAGGLGYNWTFKGTALVSFDPGSLFMFLYDNAGQPVEVLLGPKGNASPSISSPHWRGTADIKLPPGMSNEARTTPEGSEFEFELPYFIQPVKVTA